MRKINWRNGEFDFSSHAHRSMLEKCVGNFTFGHFRVGPGFATIAGGRIDNRLYYGITFCSPQDNFSKRSGRAYACRNLRETEYSHMRGVLLLEGAVDDAQPAIVLKKAVEAHLTKMRPDQRPQWTKGSLVEFRGQNYDIGEVAAWLNDPNT